MIPATTKRVQRNTDAVINQRIRYEMLCRVEKYRHAAPKTIDKRLKQLDHEWDTERVLEANAASLALTGCVLAATKDSRWVLLPMAVTAFLLQHAVQGWCPPLPMIRRLGVRTQGEIEEERYALLALRDEVQRQSSADPISQPSRIEAEPQVVEM